MTKHIRSILGCAVLTMLAFIVDTSLAQRPQVQLDPEPNPFDDKIWVLRMKLEFADRKPDLKKLAVARRDAARKVVVARFSEFASGGRAVTETIVEDSKRLLDAELAVPAVKQERIAALENHWLLTKKVEQIQKAKFDAGRIGPAEYYTIVGMRLEAELLLAKAQMD